MHNPNANRFFFSAYANSLSAVLHQPVKAFLSDVPCAAIPVTGGLISQSRENISFRIESQEILRTGRVSTTVLGERREDHYVTLATSTVENLNIFDVLRADAVVSRVTSVYPAGNSSQNDVDPKFHKARFYVAGSHFDNLRINGKQIECTTASPFDSDDGFLVKELEIRHASLFTEGCRELRIKEFGTIHLGAVDIYSAKTIVTMLRVELGCPIVATVTVAGSSTNGTDG